MAIWALAQWVQYMFCNRDVPLPPFLSQNVFVLLFLRSFKNILVVLQVCFEIKSCVLEAHLKYHREWEEEN